ncbi:hypothetical protein SERLA73DRAFT_158732 [Serpula lacrymans var. lacrymans S7.3]|uniref:Uncharacterized protein n=2 Tax=Serpula lacrymans var. lacrymans TaxID=341189 RepID=F8PNF5_SERL3|nr:uncharacterized protein SERLADRAFT_413593 [Serpula lacrymans var. lacrymans S7.9]EGO03137.1 hypothetical protein SERLA73DRAFT_158732 [Serpula lacrymans var. lacrymans S7.3]EGO28903.1 hypothetical protein SERLADRAFT_413593 [Serpula lacrymans var. lacrymans S7.9]
MPAELSAPLPQTTLETTVDEPAPPRSLTAAKLPPLKKIPKKWRWTGELFADVSRGKADRLGEVELTDATDAQPGGARFSILLDALNSLRIRRLYDESDLNMILPACGPVHQFGKLGPTDTQDKDAMKALVRYMDVKQQVTFIKLSLDDAEVAMLILFPPTLRDPCDRLAVPAHLTVRGSRESDRLIVVLVPFVLTSAKYKAHEVGMPIDAILRRLPNIDGTDPDGLERRYRSLVSKQYFYRATNILQISQELRDFMSSRSPRPYCIWSSVEDGSSSFTVEANLLKAVLEKCGAPDVGYSAEARVVFVHNGALSTLHKLPALAERRGQRSEVRFFTFGTHETVSPDRWGVREIYPIGGIITFTPSALLNDPFGVYELMTKVTNHPLWECYLLPSVLGFYCQILRGDHESDLSLLSPFLKLVEDGSVAPLWSPPSPGRSFLQGQASWVDWLLETQSQPFPDMLESCVRVFKQKYSDIPVSDQLLNMEAEIAKDMCSMQTQPSIADEYRRFVVIKAPSETHIGWDHEALEWYTADDFDFKDDYFLKEEIE